MGKKMGKWGNTGENDRNEGKIKGEDKRGEHRGVECGWETKYSCIRLFSLFS